MSKITTVYETLITELTTLLTGKTRLFNPYDITNNPEQILRDGWGLRKLGTEPAETEYCNWSDAHSFEVVLTREVVRAETQVETIDTEVIAILEDAFSVRDRVYKYDELGIPTDITAVTLGSVSPIDNVIVGNGRFITVFVAFTVQVTENFT